MRETTDREQIRELISRTARAIDAGDIPRYIGCFADAALYTLEADSGELGRRVKWLELEKDELQALLEEAPDHIHDLANRMHQITTDEITLKGDQALVFSTFAVFRTDPTGKTEIYAVGHYEDTLIRESSAWLIQSRHVLVKTRMFRTPTPMPL